MVKKTAYLIKSAVSFFGVVSMVLYFVYIVTLSLLAFQCVIVGLQSTGEARTLEQLEESGGDLTDFVSTAK